MGNVRSFRDLRVWQEAAALYGDVVRLTAAWPDDRAALADQMRRAARGVHACIAEGNGKSSRRDYVRLLHDARGSLQELESDVHAIRPCALLTPYASTLLVRRVANVGRLLAALIRSLKPPP